jgi:triosephosphate isomerase
MVREKIVGARRAGLVAVLCVGETQLQRQAGKAADIVSAQLAGSVPKGATCANLVVAYEPVWAIGTGLTATLEDIATMHATVRACMPGGRADPLRRLGKFAERRRHSRSRRGRRRTRRRSEPRCR